MPNANNVFTLGGSGEFGLSIKYLIIVNITDIEIVRNLFPSEVIADAVLAFCQLLCLSDAWNARWKPAWKILNGRKYLIIV